MVTELPAADRAKGKPASQIPDDAAAAPAGWSGHTCSARFYLEDVICSGKVRRYTLPQSADAADPAQNRARAAWPGRARTMTIGMADVERRFVVLQIPLNAPVAQVRRIALDRQGTIVYVGEGVYRGDAIAMEIELR